MWFRSCLPRARPGQPVPAYTCTQLVGLTWDGTENAYAGTLLANGTVIGVTTSGGGIGFPNDYVSSWNSSGTRSTTPSGTTPLVNQISGTDAGQVVINGDEVWNGSSYTAIPSSQLPSGSSQNTYGMTNGGLMTGQAALGQSWAYDINTKAY